MKLYYYFDETHRNCLNRTGLDDTTAYIPALAAFMGVTVQPVAARQLDCLKAEDILLVGAQRIDSFPDCQVILMGSPVVPETFKGGHKS